MALVRRSLWCADQFSISDAQPELVIISGLLFEHLPETLCNAT
jgi:hypothetical protein